MFSFDIEFKVFVSCECYICHCHDLSLFTRFVMFIKLRDRWSTVWDFWEWADRVFRKKRKFVCWFLLRWLVILSQSYNLSLSLRGNCIFFLLNINFSDRRFWWSIVIIIRTWVHHFSEVSLKELLLSLTLSSEERSLALTMIYLQVIFMIFRREALCCILSDIL